MKPRVSATTAAIRNGQGHLDQGRDVELARYLAESARWEIGRISESSTALLTALSFVGTVAGAGFAVLARQGHPFSALVLALAALLMLGSFLETIRSLRPRLPKRGGGTGWPALLGTDPGWPVTRYIHDLVTDPAGFYANDAKTLAEIAFAKHSTFRAATTLLLIGVPVGVLGGVFYAAGI